MLRKLGKHLTILNFAISSAILVAMAFLALSITERMISTQNETELNVFARWFLQTYHEIVNTETDIRFRMPEQYNIVMQNEEGQVSALSETPMTDEEITGILQQTLQRHADQLNVILEGKGSEIIVSQVRNEAPTLVMATGYSMRNAIYSDFFAGFEGFQPARMAYTLQENLLVRWKTNRYRVSTTVIDSQNAYSIILVLQNRKVELAAFYRLRLLFGSCVSVGLLVIVLASLYVSARAIRPIEYAIKQQQAFVAAASHELRTPVAALRANAEVLRDAHLTEEYTPYLDSILSVGERMTLFISDLIDMARADAGELSMQKTLVDAGEVTQNAIQWMRPLAEQKNISIAASTAPMIIIADSDRLRQVLTILLDNAIRYTPSGGHVHVSVERNGQWIELRVSDNGNGIPDAHKERVFERFYRLDEARSRESGGIGLGLSIAKQLVRQMDGNITLQDNTGGGACFIIQFKVAKRRALQGLE